MNLESMDPEKIKKYLDTSEEIDNYVIIDRMIEHIPAMDREIFISSMLSYCILDKLGSESRGKLTNFDSFKFIDNMKEKVENITNKIIDEDVEFRMTISSPNTEVDYIFEFYPGEEEIRKIIKKHKINLSKKKVRHNYIKSGNYKFKFNTEDSKNHFLNIF